MRIMGNLYTDNLIGTVIGLSVQMIGKVPDASGR